MDSLAVKVSTPTAPLYRHFLRPAQVQARFGATPGHLAAVRAWLRAEGLTAGPPVADGLMVRAYGNVAGIDRAFGIRILRLRLPGGRVAYANDSAPRVPARLRPFVTAVVGLDNLLMPQSYPGTGARLRYWHRKESSAGPQPCARIRHFRGGFTATQIAHAYGFDALYRQGLLGRGITVALVELADYANRDIATYARCYGVRPDVRRVRVDGGTTVRASGKNIVEITADIEVIVGMAPAARILAYEAPPARGLEALLDTYASILTQDRAQVVSTSYGVCEPDLLKAGRSVVYAEEGIFADMAIQGQSMLAASGDSGSEACLATPEKHPATRYQLAVSDPAGDPYVTGVGGTAIVRYGAPPLETAWNQSGAAGDGRGFRAPFNGKRGRPSRYPGNLAGGGGISGLWQMPSWQRGFDTSGNSSARPCGAPAGKLCREVPDVSALAAASLSTPGYIIYGTAGQFRGSGWQAAGGTSLATPLWAALAALAGQHAVGHRLGLLSPALYQVDRADPAAFGDIIRGDNNYLARGGTPSNFRCRYRGRLRQPCYEATRGYDMATGLGSPDAARLAADLDALLPPSAAGHRPSSSGSGSVPPSRS